MFQDAHTDARMHACTNEQGKNSKPLATLRWQRHKNIQCHMHWKTPSSLCIPLFESSDKLNRSYHSKLNRSVSFSGEMGQPWSQDISAQCSTQQFTAGIHSIITQPDSSNTPAHQALQCHIESVTFLTEARDAT